MNPPPEVTIPAGSNGRVPLAILSDPTLVMVMANDPQGEILSFLWSVPRATSAPNVEVWPNDSGDWVSSLLLPAAWANEGDVIEVTISDQAQPRNVVSVQWEVVVPQ